LNETNGKTNTIAEAIIIAISEGHYKPTVDSPVAEIYKRLKAHIEKKYGKDSEFFRAVLNLEKKPKSKGSQGTVWDKLEENVGVENDSELFMLALALKDNLKQIQAEIKQPDVLARIDVEKSNVGAIAHKLKVSGGIHLKADDAKDWEKFYLRRLITNCDPLDLAVTEETCEPSDLTDKLPPIRVSDVFTTLYLKYPERRSGQSVKDAIEKRDKGKRLKGQDRFKEEDRIPIQAVEAVNSCAKNGPARAARWRQKYAGQLCCFPVGPKTPGRTGKRGQPAHLALRG
jgi:hypothetical protein